MYAIKRFQATSGTWYWCVHFCRRGKRHYHRFYEPMHGGSKAALKAAIAWRDKMLAEVEALQMLEFCQQKRSNNTSGVPGVHFLKPTRQPEGIWQARLKLADGTCLSKSFSVRTYGDRKAFELAVAARQDMLSSVRDKPYLHSPVARRFANRQRRQAPAPAPATKPRR